MPTTATGRAPLRRDARPGNGRFLDALKRIVGPRHVLTSPASTRTFRTGFRFGSGPASAVVRPGSLVEQWRVLQACAAANKVVIMQAANTGLTGGSTPDGSDYDRDVVIVSTLRMAKIRLIGDGRQVICLSGATLFQLENALKPLGREPHSVIGSSCIGASVIGGICNNSGGALIHRGPAYTQMTLFARIDETGEVQLVNHLGVRLDGPEQILDRVVHNAFAEADIDYTSNRVALDRHYGQDVRDIDADTPGRFNADPKRLFEASGRAGKVMIFAVRLDTFPKFAVKARADAIASRLGLRDFSDKITQMGSHLFPKHLPRQMREYRDKYEHYLILKSLTRIASATRYPLYSRRDITASPDGVT